ncbi:protein kinase [Streptomyces sp. SL13]|uniref:non-specific serine/threonine protein kinase n=1 Tax=Streptantibioticus silvisoli TaxID=2705255 RepID=A0AA90H836_9ACTN|nr:serine/threonine-protein kinase [Streptantibioticus silvisoli]MDI5972745.1 protein kinase [Streptantibioticus silvisoli]
MSDQGRLVAGRYRLAEPIGRGGMGTVWRAEDELLGRQVAVKKLRVPPELQDDERERLYERTRREARSAARITHPNVVVVHDVVEDDGLPCVVMEYVRSRTLSDVLKNEGPISPKEAARIGRGMVAALRAAHRAGVLHRDVKPANVLLGTDAPHGDDGWPGGRVVLTDFGIASASGTSTLTRTGELIGSFDYLAPERITGGTPGPASDLWALGATLYQAVEGVAPFHRDTPIETAYAIASEPLVPMRNAGPLVPLIESLLAKEPEQRMTGEQVERLLVSSVETVLTRDPAGPHAGSAGAVNGPPTAGAMNAAPTTGVTNVPAADGETNGTPGPGGANGTGSGYGTPGTGSGTGTGSASGYGAPGSASGNHGTGSPSGYGTPGTDSPSGTPGSGTGSGSGDPAAPAPRRSAPSWAVRDDALLEGPTTSFPRQSTGPDAQDAHAAHASPDPGDPQTGTTVHPAGHTRHSADASHSDDAPETPDAPAADASRADPGRTPPYGAPRQRGRGRGRRGSRAPWAVAIVIVVAVVTGGGVLLAQQGALPWQRLGGGGGGSPSPEPSRSTTPAPPPTAPPGYRMVHDPAGFTMAVPADWKREAKPPDETDYISPDGRSGLKISILDYAGPALQHWIDLEKVIEPQEPQYHQLRMNATPVTVGDSTEKGAIWEWTWNGAVRKYHAIDLGFGKPGGTGYALYLSAPDEQWNQELPVFTVATRTFRPAG